MEEPAKKILDIFSQPTEDCLNNVSQTARKRSRAVSAEEDGQRTKREKTVQHLVDRNWAINGAISATDALTCYYLDPGTQAATMECLDTVRRRKIMLLWGGPASGKSTRLLWIQRKLLTSGYQPLYVSFKSLETKKNRYAFWKSFGNAVLTVLSTTGHSRTSHTPILSHSDFLHYFDLSAWDPPNLVLLLDDFSRVHDAVPEVIDDCIRTFREIRNSDEGYAVRSIIAAGTSSMLHLVPSTSHTGSFNCTLDVQNPYFSVQDTRMLFRQFAEDNNVSIDDAVVKDVWNQTNGHPALVSLCGRIIYNNLEALLDAPSKTVSYQNWRQFSATELYSEISAQDSVRSMLEPLSSPNATDSVLLLRFRFAGNIDDVEMGQWKSNRLDFLIAAGVLLRAGYSQPYRIASPLLDVLIRTKVIPAMFSDAPLTAPPLRDDGKAVDVLECLIGSLAFFDKEVIRMAEHWSCKRVKATIRRCVPRECVYDTELTRVLVRWLQMGNYGWTVTCQWQLTEDCKYSNTVLKMDQRTIVLAVLASEDPSSIESHIRRTLEDMVIHSADEAWVVHFTREDDYRPVWQSDTELSKGVHVVHFAHDAEFTNVRMSARWMDGNGDVQLVEDGLWIPPEC